MTPDRLFASIRAQVGDCDNRPDLAHRIIGAIEACDAQRQRRDDHDERHSIDTEEAHVEALDELENAIARLAGYFVSPPSATGQVANPHTAGTPAAGPGTIGDAGKISAVNA